jgi:isocitrate dehydrogenase
VASALAAGEEAIIAELTAAQGSPQALGGYYMPEPRRTGAAMRPSARLNSILDEI